MFLVCSSISLFTVFCCAATKRIIPLLVTHLIFKCTFRGGKGETKKTLSRSFPSAVTHAHIISWRQISFCRYQCNWHMHTHTFWHMAREFSWRCCLPFMLDVISEWRWYRAVSFLRGTRFKKTRPESCTRRMRLTLKLYRSLMESGVHACTKAWFNDPGCFHLVRLHS